jgi:hypothetical protein
MPPKAGDEAVKGGTNVDVTSTWEMDFTQRTNLDPAVSVDIYAEAVTPPGYHEDRATPPFYKMVT